MSYKSSDESTEPIQGSASNMELLEIGEQRADRAVEHYLTYLLHHVPFKLLLQNLTAREKELSELYYSTGLPTREIAKVMGEEPNRIRRDLSRMNRKIQMRAKALVRAGELETPEKGREQLENLITLTIPQREFEALTARVLMILAEARQSERQVAKDQKEINYLKMETRQLLERLRAA